MTLEQLQVLISYKKGSGNRKEKLEYLIKEGYLKQLGEKIETTKDGESLLEYVADEIYED